MHNNGSFLHQANLLIFKAQIPFHSFGVRLEKM